MNLWFVIASLKTNLFNKKLIDSKTRNEIVIVKKKPIIPLKLAHK